MESDELYADMNGIRLCLPTLIVCLLVFNITLTSEVLSRRCLLVAVILWPMCFHTGMPCHRHRIWHPTHHSIQTRGRRPVVVLSIDVERHTGIHYPFQCLGSDQIGKSFLDLQYTPTNTQLYDAVVVTVSQKLGRKCTIPAKSWTWDLWCENPLR